jgi:hypothetical protein
VCRPATDWPAVEVAGLTRNSRGKIAVVGHQSLTVLSLIIFLVQMHVEARVEHGSEAFRSAARQLKTGLQNWKLKA